jgi:hypothetical protein
MPNKRSSIQRYTSECDDNTINYTKLSPTKDPRCRIARLILLFTRLRYASFILLFTRLRYASCVMHLLALYSTGIGYRYPVLVCDYRYRYRYRIPCADAYCHNDFNTHHSVLRDDQSHHTNAGLLSMGEWRDGTWIDSCDVCMYE